MTDGEPETVVSASLQKIKSIKNPIKHFISYFYFIKSETSDSFVNHFDGHFAYLKTLDFNVLRCPVRIGFEKYSVVCLLILCLKPVRCHAKADVFPSRITRALPC